MENFSTIFSKVKTINPEYRKSILTVDDESELEKLPKLTLLGNNNIKSIISLPKIKVLVTGNAKNSDYSVSNFIPVVIPKPSTYKPIPIATLKTTSKVVKMPLNQKEKDEKHTKEVYKKIQQIEPNITKMLVDITSSVNGAKMAGLNYRLKTYDSLTRKLKKKRKTIDDLYDVVRYTQVSNIDDLVKNTNQTLKILKANGNRIVEINNYWLNKNSSYKGINVKLETKDGVRFELQFHYPEDLVVKEQMHLLYEEYRKAVKYSTKWFELNKKMLEISKILEKPKDIEKIGN